jgi:hypothetical protein
VRNLDHPLARRSLLDWLLGAGLFAGSFLLYLNTLAPSVATIFDDSLEFQLVCYLPGIAHPSGYPLYTLLGKLFTFLPAGDVAYRVNLMSAFFAALTVALVYATLRLLVGHRVPAFLGAAIFAVSPVFWSQAVIAEVYTLNAAFVAATLCLLLAWSQSSREERVEQDGRLADPTTLLSLLALIYGLSLTHHRTMLLLAPAALIFVTLVDRRVLTNRRLLARLALLLVAPLALYLYLPLRGLTMSSLNGVYENTLTGFLSYIAAGSYGVFLTENPLAQSRDLAFYASLLLDQFTWAGIILTAVGVVYSFTRRRTALLLLLYALTTALFALGYRVPDIQVFLIPLFLICALWVGMGFAALWELILTALRRFRKGGSARLRYGVYSGLLMCGALLPLYLWQAHAEQIDLSQRWEVHDYGMDVLSQPLEENAVVVGILGEMTLLDYFQSTERLKPALTTIPADTEEERLAVVSAQMESGRPVYLTRPLNGVEERYHLSNWGPLVRVSDRPPTLLVEPGHVLSVPFGEAILLRGYDTEPRDTNNGQSLRVTLYWESLAETEGDYKVSLRLLDAEGHLGAVRDAFPVLDAYRTNAWRPGEVIVDTHDLDILAGLPPGDYAVSVTMYDPDSLAPLASTTLGTVTLPPTLRLDRAGPWDVQHRTKANLGGRVRLLGYSVIGEGFKAGDEVAITLLWQGLDRLADEYTVLLWLEGDAGLKTGERETILSGRYPTAAWQEGEVVRDWQSFIVPSFLEDGRYRLKLQVRAQGEALGRLLSVLPTSSDLDLGQIEVKSRERSFDLPAMDHALEAQLGESVRLLGYDLEPPQARPGEGLTLTLYWQCLRTMDTSYTVFVHLLQPSADIHAQRDSLPGQGSLPTTSWVEGEVIVDPYEIPLSTDAPPGDYTIIAGLYDATTGDRLPAFDAEGNHLGDHLSVTELQVFGP